MKIYVMSIVIVIVVKAAVRLIVVKAAVLYVLYVRAVVKAIRCYNYYNMCDILLPNRNLIYSIFIRKCCLDKCPYDSCCCDTVEFAIKNTKFETVGEIIRKKKCNICGIS